MTSDTTAIKNIILKHLKIGFTLTEDLKRYIEATSGTTNRESLIKILQGPELFDTGLADLLFSPNEALRLDLEEHIPAKGLTSGTINLLKKDLFKSLEQHSIVINNESIFIKTDGAFIDLFINSMNLTFPGLIDPNTVKKRDLALKARMIIRSQSSQVPEVSLDFLKDLIVSFTKSPVCDPVIFIEAVHLALALIKVSEADLEMLDVLSQHKIQLQQQLGQKEAFERDFSRFSMDYLMTQRIQVPSFDTEAVNREIFLIDKIAFTVFGMAAESMVPEVHRDLDVKESDQEAVEKVMRFLN